jgi:two-component system LytT family sensor kinase
METTGSGGNALSNANPLQRRWVRWLLVFGVWTLFGLIDTGQSRILHNTPTEPFPWMASLAFGVSDWYIWALLTPLIVWTVRRFPLGQQNWPLRLPLHLGVGGLCAAVVTAVSVPIVRYLVVAFGLQHRLAYYLVWSPAELFSFLFINKLFFYLLVYGVVAGIVHGLIYYRKFRYEELEASRLETQLAQAQLQVLRVQLHPHFLFNTLHTISALLHQDVELADKMIARLGELLRSTLQNAGAQEVPLRQELATIRPYLEIEQARLGPRLSLNLDVTPDALEAYVPNLLLQPLVENAIRHGVAPCTGPGRVEIWARREADRLHVEVRDTGPGLPGDGETADGVGVSNTRARLRHLYGPEHVFTLAPGHNGGLVVSVAIPFHHGPNGAAAPRTDLDDADPNPDRG